MSLKADVERRPEGQDMGQGWGASFMRSQRNHGLSEADFSCKPLLKSTPCEASPSSSTDRGKPTPGYQTVCTEYRARATLQLSFSITGTLCHSRAYQQLRGWRSYLWKVLLQWCTPQPWLRGTRKKEWSDALPSTTGLLHPHGPFPGLTFSVQAAVCQRRCVVNCVFTPGC